MTTNCLHDQPPLAARITKVAFVIAVTVALLGCATPEGTVKYYLPKAETIFKVTQTLTCNSKGDRLVQVVDVTSSTSYSSDLSAPVEIHPKAIDGWLSNADIAFAFTNDGRLAGVNVTTVGQGGEVVKDVLAVAKVVAAAAAAAPNSAYNVAEACKVIAQYSAKPVTDDKKDDKPKAAAAAAPPAGAPVNAVVTLSYEGKVGYKRLTSEAPPYVHLVGANPHEIPVAANSAKIWFELSKYIPSLGFNAKVGEADKLATPSWIGSTSDVNIKVNSVANAVVEVNGLAADLSDASKLATFWRGEVPVPLTSGKGDLFDVPIPKAAVFGTRKFVLSLTDYGSISKLQYATTGGVSDASAAFAAIGTALVGTKKDLTVAQQADAEKAEGDLIYQQQRKALCIAKPESCPK